MRVKITDFAKRKSEPMKGIQIEVQCWQNPKKVRRESLKLRVGLVVVKHRVFVVPLIHERRRY